MSVVGSASVATGVAFPLAASIESEIKIKEIRAKFIRRLQEKMEDMRRNMPEKPEAEAQQNLL